MHAGNSQQPSSEVQLHENTEDKTDRAKDYAFKLGKRVRSFKDDRLHSLAYLNLFAQFLQQPYQQPKKRPSITQQPNAHSPWPFVVHYPLQSKQRPEPGHIQRPEHFSKRPQSGNEIVFLIGRPSAEWVNCIGAEYQLDHRFWHQHIGSIPSFQSYSLAVPSLPSRSLQVLRLRVPTCMSIGASGRNLSIEALWAARNDCKTQIEKLFPGIQHNDPSKVGEPIIRRLDIYDGGSLVMEQELTILPVWRDGLWSVIVWSDAGGDIRHVPRPSTKGFPCRDLQLEFNPVFFEKDMDVPPPALPRGSHARIPNTTQPLGVLSSRYGLTLDWNCDQSSMPLFAIQELLRFQAASVLQYLNLLESVLAKLSRGHDPRSYETTKLETLVHYNYIRSGLLRVRGNLLEVTAFLRTPPSPWKAKQAYECQGYQNRNAAVKPMSEAWRSLQADFKYLVSRTNFLLGVCGDGKSTLLNNEAVQEARRSAKEAKLATKLSRTANRITFIFLPISFLTSIFGMNFSQFGQGGLSIWMWVYITIPLLLVSIITVEFGSWIKKNLRASKLREALENMRKDEKWKNET